MMPLEEDNRKYYFLIAFVYVWFCVCILGNAEKTSGYMYLSILSVLLGPQTVHARFIHACICFVEIKSYLSKTLFHVFLKGQLPVGLAKKGHVSLTYA